MVRKGQSLIFAILLGVILGLTAKLVDVPEITGIVPIFDQLFGRFGVWIFTATLLAVASCSPGRAAVRVFLFFIAMLTTYYVYTVLFLGFYPRSQIILWGLISLLSPVCATIIWHAGGEGWTADILAALPITALAAEWYMTGQEELLLAAVYICMGLYLLIGVPRKLTQRAAVAAIAVVMSLFLIKTEAVSFVFGLLNV